MSDAGSFPIAEFDGYELIRQIGKGGMGEVHLARDTLLDRLVAVKFISAPDCGEAERQRFLIEARAIARLQHPNVVSVYRVGEVDGFPYLVSEFVRGNPLNEIPVPITSQQSIRIAMDIACGLAAAHRRGVVHRDIKPANAILSDDGVVKLLDFGIAKLLEPMITVAPQKPWTLPPTNEMDGIHSEETLQLIPEQIEKADSTILQTMNRENSAEPLTDSGMVLGTPEYMAPEIWRGEPATFRSDIYSFGVLLYKLCSGRPPHTSRNMNELYYKVHDQDARFLSEVAPQVDARFAAIVDRCLKRDPTSRFGSGNEIRSALAQLTEESRAGTVPEGNPYRGLHAFEAEHQNLFFGRDSEISTILEQLQVEAFVAVAGDSGVGKSSLCRAGVLPRINEKLGTGRKWSVVTLVPGRHPVTSLCAALAPTMGESEKGMTRAIMYDPGGFGRKLRASQGSDFGVVIFIDQLEELVTISDPQEATAVSEVLGWLAAPAPGVRLLVTARGDFLSRIAALPQIGDEISRALYFLRPLSSERIREAIIGPAQVKGVAFESQDLVDELVESTERSQGGLPLLQFALAELWEARDPNEQMLSRAALNNVGGVGGALTRHADRVMVQMNAKERVAARRVLLQLVTADETRARKTDEELGADNPMTRAALDALIRGRLVVARDTVEGAGYEIAHEALIQGWTTLSKWLSADADARLVRERLRTAVREWERLGRVREALWSARQLNEAEVVDRSSLPRREMVFLNASLRAVRRARMKRVSLLVSVPAIILVIYTGLQFKARRDVDRRVEDKISIAKKTLKQARTLSRETDELRSGAIDLFDKMNREEAEEVWSRYLKLAANLQPIYSQATQELETALLLDHDRADVLGMFADVLYERTLLAEKRGDSRAQAELLQRLALYDNGGIRFQKWKAPAYLTITTRPKETSIALVRFVPDDRGKLLQENVELPPGPISKWKLSQGSYLAMIEAPGHEPTRFPFILGRGELFDVNVVLPKAEQVPPGFVYVPKGRFLFGSGAEDSQRRDFFHTVPIHNVETGPYLIARDETTFSDWLEYLGALAPNVRAARVPKVGRGGFQGALTLTERAGGDWKIMFQPTTRPYSASVGNRIVYPARDRRAEQDWLKFPVFGISIDDAKQYVDWLAGSGKVPNARLCTEFEWEKGARGSDGREFPHGEVMNPDDANYDDTYGKETLGIGPDEVSSHSASNSPFGLSDMAGNVWEWARSSVSENEYAARGGSYSFGANSSRTTDREVTEPSFRDVSVGMRVCADIIPSPVE
ncbi:MAG: protein kinase [Proteobacteria bacterium]|nr:protein kinase [Pseudomonadota bacterium]